MRLRFLPPLAALALATTAFGQEQKAAPPDSVEVRYADGSVVKLTLLEDSVEIATRFGSLKVPGRDVQRVEFGPRLPEAAARRIQDALAKLAGADEKERPAAAAALVALGESAYPFVEAATKSADPAQARRARDVLATLDEKVPAEKRRKAQDTVVTTDFPIVGRVVGDVLKARSPFFGEVRIKISEVHSLRWLGSERETRVSLDAARYGLPQQTWLDTGIDVAGGTKLEVKATGAVDLYPGQGGRFTSSPDGLLAGGVPMIGVKGGGAVINFTPGALIGRIGEKGATFVVGQKYEGTPREEGKLYLLVAPSPWGVAPTGNYDVRVTTGGR